MFCFQLMMKNIRLLVAKDVEQVGKSMEDCQYCFFIISSNRCSIIISSSSCSIIIISSSCSILLTR